MISRINKAQPVLFLCFFFTFSYAGQNMMLHDALWQMTKALKSAWGKNADAVSEIIQQPLVRTQAAADDRYTSAPFTLADGTRITGLDVRLWGNGDSSVALVSFVIDKPCITLEQIKEQFPDVTLVSVPRGNTSNQSLGYRTSLDEKGLAWAFSFPTVKQECLRRISISRYSS